MRLPLLALITLGLVGACAHMPAVSLDANERQSGFTQIARVAYEFAPVAEKQVADDARFNSVALGDAVAAELTARQMLDLQNKAGRIAVIRIDEFSVRSTSNVVLFGRAPSAAVLAASVRIRDPATGKVQEFQVHADIPLKISRRGIDKEPFRNLYRGFASLVAEKLAAMESGQQQRQ